MKHPLKVLTVPALVALALAAGCAGNKDSTPRGGGSATVEFINPERFLDFRAGGNYGERDRDAMLADLKRFIEKEAAEQLPPDRHLDIRILDLDQAGAVRPNAGSVRVVYDVESARADLEYTLKSGDAVLRSGKESIHGSNPPGGFTIPSASKSRLLEEAFRNWLRKMAR